jgi:drug/metabolite transporter (DMT)-like permease
MWRAVVEAVGPFLIPFALYALWIAALKRTTPASAQPQPPRSHPWIALSVAGLLLAFAVLWFTTNRNRMEVGTRYAPAVLQDGRILPGGAAAR